MEALTSAALREVDRRSCAHDALAYLGNGGPASYYRCRSCGAGVVEERGRRWVLRPIAQ